MAETLRTAKPRTANPAPAGRQGVRSATHFWFGAAAVKSRCNRSVRRRRVLRVLPGRAVLPAPAQVGALAHVGAHDPRHPFAADLDATVAQLKPHPRRAVGRVVLKTTHPSRIAPANNQSPVGCHGLSSHPQPQPQPQPQGRKPSTTRCCTDSTARIRRCRSRTCRRFSGDQIA